MFPELRSRTNALEHCGSLGENAFFFIHISFTKVLTLFLGGHVVVPKTEKQNLDVVAIAEQYYKVENQAWVFINTYTKQICEAKQNSGKTIWIGIDSQVNMNEWKISGENEKTSLEWIWLTGGNMTGKRVGYTNWKDASPNGNCAYLFTKVRQSSRKPWTWSLFITIGNC